MKLAHYKPIKDLFRASDLERPFGQLFDLFRGFDSFAPQFSQPLDIIENEKELLVEMDLPGISIDDISVTLDDGVLTVSGFRKAEEEKKGSKLYWKERRFGEFSRSISVPDYIRESEISAKYSNGVLKIRLPKSEKVTPKKVKISVDK